MKRRLAVFSITLFLGALCVSAQDDPKPTRVQFPRGGTTATIKGSTNAWRGASYALGARAGQQMTVEVSSDAGDVSMQVLQPGGATGLNGVTEQKRWSGRLPKSGDYTINVIEATGQSVPFTLAVSVVSAPAIAETPAGKLNGARTPEAAAQALFKAWKARDRKAALLVASPTAVKALFKDKPLVGSEWMGCTEAEGSYSCIYDYEAGGLIMTIKGSAAAGYRVVGIEYGLD